MLLIMLMCVCICARACVCQGMWIKEGYRKLMGVSFHHAGLWDWTQVFRRAVSSLQQEDFSLSLQTQTLQHASTHLNTCLCLDITTCLNTCLCLDITTCFSTCLCLETRMKSMAEENLDMLPLFKVLTLSSNKVIWLSWHHLAPMALN